MADGKSFYIGQELDFTTMRPKKGAIEVVETAVLWAGEPPLS